MCRISHGTTVQRPGVRFVVSFNDDQNLTTAQLRTVNEFKEAQNFMKDILPSNISKERIKYPEAEASLIDQIEYVLMLSTFAQWK